MQCTLYSTLVNLVTLGTVQFSCNIVRLNFRKWPPLICDPTSNPMAELAGRNHFALYSSVILLSFTQNVMPYDKIWFGTVRTDQHME